MRKESVEASEMDLWKFVEDDPQVFEDAGPDFVLGRLINLRALSLRGRSLRVAEASPSASALSCSRLGCLGVAAARASCSCPAAAR